MVEVAASFSREVIDRVARELVRVEFHRSSATIATPVLYPSGSTVVVQIKEAGPQFFVTDMGLGYQEAEMMGAAAIYRNEARVVAEAAGVGFDNHAFFQVEVPRDQLAGAIVVIANCSSEAAVLAAYKLSQPKEDNLSAALYERLVGVFTTQRVQRDVHMRGASDHNWKISSLVTHGARATIFEPVRKQHASVYATATKFHDLARLRVPPRRVAVVESKAKMEDYLGLLAQAGNVIERDASDQIIRDLAEAA